MKLSQTTVTRLARLIGHFKSTRILVLGDVMLDQFVWGSVRRISPEAPVPVVEVTRETTHLGGAANVAHNLWALGGAPQVIGVVGDDHPGRLLDQELRRLHPEPGLINDEARPTTVKTRIIAHHQQVCRTDRESDVALGDRAGRAVMAAVDRWLADADGIIVSDYAKGVISGPLMQHVMRRARTGGLFVCVDPKVRNFGWYRGATVITPNQHEAEAVAGVAIRDEGSLRAAGKKILLQTGCRYLLITRGEAGMALFLSPSQVIHIPAVAREVFDVTGAGDTVIATLAMGLAHGAAIADAARLSNFAAGIVVGKLGTASVTAEELLAYVRAHAEEITSPKRRR